MTDDLRAMTLFVRTVEMGSFRAAADTFALSPSVVSYHITQLEKKFGVALLYRSTRKLSLTHKGKQVFEHAKQMTLSADAAINVISGHSATPHGKLTVSFPAALVRSPFLKKITAFASEFADIHLSLVTTDRRVDLIGEGIDIAVRVGDMADSALKSIYLGDIHRKLVASPELVAALKAPHQPEELNDWPWIRLQMLPQKRQFVNANGKTVNITFDARINVDSVEAMHQMTLQGLGVSTPPDYLVARDLNEGYLVELLPGWTVSPMKIHAVWPPNVSKSSLTALILDFLRRPSDT
jgi:DNA-binding transcriptional LysR family regulator